MSLNAPLPTPTDELDAAAWRLEGHSPERILAVTAARFAPRIAFATGFGAEGCVLLDMIGRHRLPIDIFTLDTGLLFPETYELWRRIEARYRLRIRAVRSELDVPAQAALHGDRLVGARSRRLLRDPQGGPAARRSRRPGRLDHRHPP